MSFSDATWRVGGVYDVCLASTEEGDMMSLMKCAIEGMDAKQKSSSVSLNTYLLVLSVSKITQSKAALPARAF